MNANRVDSEGETQRPTSVRFGPFFAATFGGHAVGMAFFVALAGLFLKAPPRSLVVPYLLLVHWGLTLPPLLYWMRLARDRPESYPLRGGIAISVYSAGLVLVLGYSAVRLRLLSVADALNLCGAMAVLVPAFAFFGGYVAARELVKARQSRQSEFRI